MPVTRSAHKRRLFSAPPRPPPKRGRKTRSIFPPFPILDLPPEIRTIILRHLLYTKEPIFFATKPLILGTAADWRAYFDSLPPRQVHTNVLYTCKTLYQDGIDILYSNTVKFQIDIKDRTRRAFATEIVLLSPIYGTNVKDLHPSVLKKINKVQIDVYLHLDRSQINDKDVQERVREVSKGIRTVPHHWTEISINLICNIGSVPPFGSYFESTDDILNPFQYLRRFSKAQVTGVSEDYGEALKRLITSDRPLVDLDLMFDPMQEAVLQRFPEHPEAAYGYGDEEDDDLNPAERFMSSELWYALDFLTDARDMCETPNFMKARSKLMLLISLYDQWKFRQLHRFDPVGELPEYSLAVALPAPGSEEYQEIEDVIDVLDLSLYH